MKFVHRLLIDILKFCLMLCSVGARKRVLYALKLMVATWRNRSCLLAVAEAAASNVIHQSLVERKLSSYCSRRLSYS
jgi:hypothetical protein